MKAKCFGCDVIVEADDLDRVADAFVAHGKASHSWSYPEQAVRNYACNYAEAVERLTGSTERLPDIGTITVHPATQERLDDWLRFFDHEAFAGNPDWASCYCLEPHAPAPPEMPERPWRTSRAMMRARICDRSTYGYIAYVDGKAAGWVNASFRSEYGIFHDVDPKGPKPSSVIAVACFVIAPPFRQHGVASALLDRVIADAKARGASWIEGYPHNKPEESAAAHFRGARSMYDRRGFEPVEVKDRYTVMRLAVR